MIPAFSQESPVIPPPEIEMEFSIQDSTNSRGVIVCPRPYYPKEAIEAGLEGEVVLEADIGLDGRASDFVVLASSGHPVLDEAAKRNMRLVNYSDQAGSKVKRTMRFEIEQ